jgi:diacylglycerol kinase (ATP)
MRTAAIKLLNATINTLRGLSCGGRERAIRQEVMVFILALPVGAFVAPGLGWYAAMIGSLLVLLAIELLNTATAAATARGVTALARPIRNGA